MKTLLTIILDLDGVLITTPNWKPDEIDTDGYSKFNENCITHLNKLLDSWTCEIFLSSSRRTSKSIHDFNQIFEHRKITNPIKEFIPIYKNCKNRKEELLQFIKDRNISNFLILDDDKSLNDLPSNHKNRLVLTELHKGFNNDKLIEAMKKLGSRF